MSLQNVNSYTYSPGFTQGQYHNAVLCISGNVQSLYLNGVLVGSTTTASNILSYYPTINQILLGCAGDKSNGFTGYLDDFRIYKYAFNQSQVSNLYSNRNLIAYYPFDACFNNVANGIVTTANSATVSYDATLVGNASISASSSQVGTGALNLSNTAGTASTSYVNSTCAFAIPATNQLSISLWFKTTGIAGRKMRLFDLCPAPGRQGIFVDISGTNGINTLSNIYPVPVVVTPTGVSLNSDSTLLLFYKFNTGDITGSTITNYAPSTTYGSGTVGTGATINTTSYKVDTGSLQLSAGYIVATSSAINFSSLTNGVSFSFWYNSTYTNTNSRVFDFGINTSNGTVITFSNSYDSNSSFYLQVIQTGNGLANVSTITPAQINAIITNFYDGNWHHYVWTLTYSASNTSTYVIYQDGVLKGTFTGNYFPTVSTNNNYIGKSNYGVANQTGYMDDFRMYSKVLSASEVTTLFGMSPVVFYEDFNNVDYTNSTSLFHPFDGNATYFNIANPTIIKTNKTTWNAYTGTNTTIVNATLINASTGTDYFYGNAFKTYIPGQNWLDVQTLDTNNYISTIIPTSTGTYDISFVYSQASYSGDTGYYAFTVSFGSSSITFNTDGTAAISPAGSCAFSLYTNGSSSSPSELTVGNPYLNVSFYRKAMFITIRYYNVSAGNNLFKIQTNRASTTFRQGFTGFSISPVNVSIQNTQYVTSISPSTLTLWLDAYNASNLTYNASKQVSVWTDKSGKGYNATKTESATVTYATKNLNPSVFFNNNGIMNISNIPLNRYPLTMFVVFTFTGLKSTSSTNMFLQGNFGTNQHMFQIYQAYDANNIAISTGATGGQTSSEIKTNALGTTATSICLLSLILPLSTSGAQATPIMNINGTSNVNMPGGGYINADGGYATGGVIASYDGMNMYLHEEILYNSALTTTEFQKIEGYLAWKWGINSKLPSSHPYYASSPTTL